MIQGSVRAGMTPRILCFILCLMLAPALASCANKQSEAEITILEYLKTHGAPDVKEVKIDLFHTSKQVPDKAYAGITATYTFGSGSGELQREPSGYILKREGGQWMVEENTQYTKEAQRAEAILMGKGKNKAE